MFKIFKRLTAKELSMIVLAVIFVCLNVYLNLKIPDYMSDITTLLSTKGTKASDIFAWNTDAPGMRMLLMSFAGFMASVVVGFLAARTAASFTTRLRDDIFHQVLDFSDAEIKQFSIPSLLTRTTNDITQLQMVLTMGLQVITQGPIMAIWAITKIADKNGNWLLALLVAVAVIAILMLFLLIMVMPKQRLIQTLTDKLNSVTRESLTGIRVVRAYNAESYQEDKFEKANTDLTQNNLFIGRSFALLTPVMTAVSSGLTLAIYWIGAHLIEDVKIPTDPTKIAGAMEDKVHLFSDMVVYSSYAMQVVMGFMMMIVVFFLLPRAVVALKTWALSNSMMFPSVILKLQSLFWSMLASKLKREIRLPLLVRLDLVNQRLSTLSHDFMMPRKELSRLTVWMYDIMTTKPCTI